MKLQVLICPSSAIGRVLPSAFALGISPLQSAKQSFRKHVLVVINFCSRLRIQLARRIVRDEGVINVSSAAI